MIDTKLLVHFENPSDSFQIRAAGGPKLHSNNGEFSEYTTDITIFEYKTLIFIVYIKVFLSLLTVSRV